MPRGTVQHRIRCERTFTLQITIDGPRQRRSSQPISLSVLLKKLTHQEPTCTTNKPKDRYYEEKIKARFRRLRRRPSPETVRSGMDSSIVTQRSMDQANLIRPEASTHTAHSYALLSPYSTTPASTPTRPTRLYILKVRFFHGRFNSVSYTHLTLPTILRV